LCSVLPDLLSPDLASWTSLMQDIRRPGLDVYVLTGVGPVSEDDWLVFRDVFDLDLSSRPVLWEARLRSRAWVREAFRRYERIVVVTGGPLARAWGEAVRCVCGTRRIRAYRVPRTGVFTSVDRERIARACRPRTRRARVASRAEVA